MNSRTSRPRGFTLVEIMMVVGIVGLLSAIAVPSLNHLKRLSEETVVMNTLRQVYDAKEYYFTETGKVTASVNGLVAQGYASKSLAAAVAHPPGNWSYSALPYLKPGQPVSSSEILRNGRRVTYGRVLQYPAN